jgi:hypothetical protein
MLQDPREKGQNPKISIKNMSSQRRNLATNQVHRAVAARLIEQ